MKADIHPKYGASTAKCSCGNVITTNSTLNSDINIEICSECHPFYTGQQKIVDTTGRVQGFADRYKKISKAKN